MKTQRKKSIHSAQRLTESKRLAQAVAFLKRRLKGAEPRVGIVLGSGMGSALDGLSTLQEISYAKIPGFKKSSVVGHAGTLAIARAGTMDVVVMLGRVHLYEGHSAKDVTFGVRVMVALGARTILLTNAAGGIDASFRPGDIMLIRDHINLTGSNPLVGPNDETLGPRFFDMGTAYSPKLCDVARKVAKSTDTTLREGVYAGLLGPNYETPAEIRMLGTLGAHAVGMSTVLETIAARHMGAEVIGLSLISNLAAGLSATPLSHEEVTETGKKARIPLAQLILGILDELAQR